MKLPSSRLAVILMLIFIIGFTVPSISNNSNTHDTRESMDVNNLLIDPTNGLGLIKVNTIYNTSFTELTIFGNAELATYANSGSGTQVDPYILENYHINGGSATYAPLYLSGVTAHTIVRNNIFDSQGTKDKAARVVVNSQNIVFENNTFMNAKVGLDISTGSNFIIREQNFISIEDLVFSNAQTLKLFRTTNTTIENLDFYNKANTAIELRDVSSSIVRNISLTGLHNGIEIYRSGAGYGENNTVTNVTIDSLAGIGVRDWGYNNTISNSTFNSSNYGVNLFDSTFTIIENNVFESIKYNSIDYSTVSSSTSGHIIRNNVFASSNSGIVALNSNVQNNSILNNTFTGNYYGIDWDATAEASNNILRYNIFKNNSYGMYFRDYAGMNVTSNYIAHSRYSGIEISATQNLWINNNTVYNSSSYGLSVVLGTTVNRSIVMYNDFIKNGGTYSQISTYNSDVIIEKNFYSDHSNIDLDSNGIADSPYEFDDGIDNDPTPLVFFSSPFYTYTIAPKLHNTNISIVYVTFGSVGNILFWVSITDDDPDTYTIFLDGVPISGHNAQTWSSGQNITLSIDGLDAGTYGYKAIFKDIQENILLNVITVIVRDGTTPTSQASSHSNTENLSSGSTSDNNSEKNGNVPLPGFSTVLSLSSLFVIVLIYQVRRMKK